MENQRSGRSLRGFASMDKSKQREIASKGGRAAHEKGTAHEFSAAEASAAAKRGHERGTAHEFTPEEARAAGRKGGMARAANRVKTVPATTSDAAPSATAPEEQATSDATMNPEPAPASSDDEGEPMASSVHHNPA